MKRLILSPAGFVIMMLAIICAQGCTPKNSECRTCTARNTANEITASTTACSVEAETQFKNAHTGMNVKCE